MEQLQDPVTEFIEGKSLMELHYESQEWSKDVEFWRTELGFFQRLLDRNVKNFKSLEQKKSLDHLQNIITYYQGELLDEMRQKVRKHGKYLATMMQDDVKKHGESYTEKHAIRQDQVMSFEKQFKKYKREFYDVFEEL